MKLGVFLTPGAARTAYTVGALQGLVEDGGLRFDVVAASSVGAVNGAFAAMDQLDRIAGEWNTWRSSDVLGIDWQGLIRGGVIWAPALMRYRSYRTLLSPAVISESRLRPGTRLRINIASLTSGDDEVLEWPGAPIAMDVGVNASVSVPAVVPPTEALGGQWVDGLTVDGFPLERVLLDTGVERAFVLGVASRRVRSRRYPNVMRILLRAAEANQLSETLVGLQTADSTNALIAGWLADRARVEDAVRGTVTDPSLAKTMLDEVDLAYREAGFPFARGVVEIVAILPDENLDFAYADYRPERSRALIERGRADATNVLRELDARGGS